MKLKQNSAAKSITITEKELDNNKGSGGLEINIPGTIGNPTTTDGEIIFIESYEGE